MDVMNLNKYGREWDELCAQGILRHVPANTILYMQGDCSTGLICLRQGMIKNSVIYENGSEKTLCILSAPAITGETSVIDDGVSINTAKAVTDIEVSIVPRNRAKAYLENTPSMMILMLKLFATKIRLIQLQAELAVLSNECKLARMLVALIENQIYCEKDSLSLRATHKQLADFIGTTRPKITMYLGHLEKLGLISKARGQLLINDLDGLMKYAYSAGCIG